MVNPFAENIELELQSCMKKAGEALLHFWPGKEVGSLQIHTKADGTPVTEADLASNEILTTALKSILPESKILSEEGDKFDIEGSGVTWIIDPLDGTKNFIAGKDDFSILVAGALNGTLEIGALYYPARDTWAFAQKGKGAFLNGEKIQIPKNISKLSSQSVYIRYLDFPKELTYPLSMDSGLAFLELARGSIAGIAIRMERHQIWDIAAPWIFLEESGAVIQYHPQSPWNIHPDAEKILVASGSEALMSEVIAAIL